MNTEQWEHKMFCCNKKEEWEEGLDDIMTQLHLECEASIVEKTEVKLRNLFLSHHNQLLDRVMEGMPSERKEWPTEGNYADQNAWKHNIEIKGYNSALSQCKESVKKLRI